MEIHQLRYLAAVVDTGSFTAAAAQEHVSQSGVSAQVGKLERELGHRLLVRSARTLALTDAGRAVLPHARAALAAVAAIGQVADDLAGLERGRVVMGMVRGCAIPSFLDALARYRLDHPGIEVALTEGDSDDLQQQVLDGRLDVALIGYAGAPLDGLDVRSVLDEGLVAVAAAGHRWAAARRRRSGIDLADLAAERVLALPVGTGVRAALDRSCARAGVDLRVDLEASSPEAVLGLAERGAGVAVVSTSMVGARPVTVRPLRDAAVPASLGIGTRTGETAHATCALAAAILAAMETPAAAV